MTGPASIAGVNIGGTTTTVVGGNDDGVIVSRWRAPTETDDGEALIAGGLGRGSRGGGRPAKRVGVAVGGPLDVAHGVITGAVHLPGLHGVALRDSPSSNRRDIR